MHPLTNQISTTLKSLRKLKKWSLDRTARETGVSKAMLGQIEREESSPTIATLWKIASGFNVSFSSFVESPDKPGAKTVLRKAKPKKLHPDDDKYHFKTIFPFDKNTKMEMYIVEISPGYTHFSPAHQSGVTEHIIPISGTVEVLIDDSWKQVHTNEGLRFTPNSEHGYRNTGLQPAVYHLILHYSSKSA